MRSSHSGVEGIRIQRLPPLKEFGVDRTALSKVQPRDRRVATLESG